MVEVPGVEHISILYAPRTHEEILTWLGAPDGPAPAPANRAFAGLALLAAFGFAFSPLANLLLGPVKSGAADAEGPVVAGRFGLLWVTAATLLAAVVAAATILVGIGYVLGAGGGSEAPVQRITMSGAGGAAASIALLARDEAGNWPMTLEVTGLAPLPRGETYTLWLTRGDELAESCGTFAVASGTTTVPLNAPYQLKKFDGWVVVRSGTERPFLLSTETS